MFIGPNEANFAQKTFHVCSFSHDSRVLTGWKCLPVDPNTFHFNAPNTKQSEACPASVLPRPRPRDVTALGTPSHFGPGSFAPFGQGRRDLEEQGAMMLKRKRGPRSSLVLGIV